MTCPNQNVVSSTSAFLVILYTKCRVPNKSNESSSCLDELQVSAVCNFFQLQFNLQIIQLCVRYLTLKYSTSSLQLILEPFISLIFRLSSFNNNGTSIWSWSLKSGSISKIKYTCWKWQIFYRKLTTAIYTFALSLQLTSAKTLHKFNCKLKLNWHLTYTWGLIETWI